jgi:hypothetical protein
MFCVKCGTELPDNSQFCSKCGKHVHSASNAPAPAFQQRHWEYNEFCERLAPYTNGKIFKSNSTYYKDGLPENTTEMNIPIGSAIRALLARVSAAGWEPTEPLEPERLWTARRIRFVKGRADLFPDPNRYRFELIDVCINCRRWVTGTNSNKSEKIAPPTTLECNMQLEQNFIEGVAEIGRAPVLVRLVAQSMVKKEMGHSPKEWLTLVRDMGSKLAAGNATRIEKSAYVAELLSYEKALIKWQAKAENRSFNSQDEKTTYLNKYTVLQNTLRQLINDLG